MTRALACLSVLALAACGPEPKLSTIQEQIFTPRCDTSGCHDAKGKAGQLELTPGKSFAQLVGVAAENVGAKDDGLVRVKAGDPDGSFLIVKINDHVPVAYGVRMPADGTVLSADEIALVTEWVKLGAKDD